MKKKKKRCTLWLALNLCYLPTVRGMAWPQSFTPVGCSGHQNSISTAVVLAPPNVNCWSLGQQMNETGSPLVTKLFFEVILEHWAFSLHSCTNVEQHLFLGREPHSHYFQWWKQAVQTPMETQWKYSLGPLLVSFWFIIYLTLTCFTLYIVNYHTHTHVHTYIISILSDISSQYKNRIR